MNVDTAHVWAQRRDDSHRRQQGRLDALHYEGVHVECRSAGGQRVGHGTARRCPRAGTVEQLHGHGFEGPLVCGCIEWAS
jgi:hypothetical protein